VGNLHAGAQLHQIVRSSLGPKAKTKMLLIPTGGVIFTKDGNAIVRDLNPEHPAANLVVQGSRAQDEEVGDGTTTVVTYTSSLLEQLIPIVSQPGMHPAFLSRSLKYCKDYLISLLDEFATTVNVKSQNTAELMKIISSTIETKQIGEMKEMICKIALQAMQIVAGKDFSDAQNIDIKNNIRILQVVGETMLDTKLIEGIVIDKDVLHPSMSRKIENPRILILEGGLEYKKGESQTMIELTNNKNFNAFLASEEQDILDKIDRIVSLKPDIVLTDKGLSELASYQLMNNKITAFRRCKKTDLARLSLASGAKIVSVNEAFSDSAVGTRCKLYETRKIGKEYYSYFEQCEQPKACTIVIRGPVKDILGEIGRNFQDALYTARSIILNPKILPGAGCIELKMSQRIHDDLSSAKIAKPIDQTVLRAFAKVLESIPVTLLENAGVSDVARQMLKIKCELNENKSEAFGIDGNTGEIKKSSALNIWDPYTVKLQCIKTAIDAAKLLTSIDEIVAVAQRKKGPNMAR